MLIFLLLLVRQLNNVAFHQLQNVTIFCLNDLQQFFRLSFGGTIFEKQCILKTCVLSASPYVGLQYQGRKDALLSFAISLDWSQVDPSGIAFLKAQLFQKCKRLLISNAFRDFLNRSIAVNYAFSGFCVMDLPEGAWPLRISAE